MRLSRVLYYSEPRNCSTYLQQYIKHLISKATTLVNGIMSKDKIITWGQEEEAILRSNQCRFIGGVQQINEEI